MSKISFISKFKFLWKKQSLIVVVGEGRESALEAISHALRPYFKVGQEILIFESKDEQIKEFEFFLKNSHKATLVITHVGDIPYDNNVFGGEKEKITNTIDLAKTLPAHVNLVLNFDDETAREVDDFTNLNTLTFGFQEGANFKASDVKLNGGTNFKINHKGNIVPVWLEKAFGKEQIYSALSAAALGTIFDLNLVEISQALKDYRSLPGKMKLRDAP